MQRFGRFCPLGWVLQQALLVRAFSRLPGLALMQQRLHFLRLEKAREPEELELLFALHRGVAAEFCPVEDRSINVRIEGARLIADSLTLYFARAAIRASGFSH